MMKRIALLILYLSIGLAATSYAEKLPYVSYYRAADGLSSQSVNCISQDEAGCSWIGSENGLDRFAGHQICIFVGIFTSAREVRGMSKNLLFLQFEYI